MRVIATAALLLAPSLLNEVSGQVGTLDDMRTNSSFYYHVEPGAPRVEVSVIGTVAKPGIYQITDQTDLGKLLALAGGPGGLQGVGGRTEVSISLYRATGGQRQLVYHSSLENHLKAVQSYPLLVDNDILMVDSRLRRGFGWREGLTVVTSLATVGLLINQWSR